MDILTYIVEQALILVPALWIVGAFLKKTPNVPDWVIPWALLAAGVGGAIAIIGTTPEAVIQGILVTGVAVLGHQIVKQTTEQK